MVSLPSRSSGRRPVESSRRAILDATESLLLEVGADRISIRGVSRRCGYQAPTIYHHFGDKRGLIDACLEERFKELLVELQRVPREAGAREYLGDMARAFVRFGLENPAHYRLLAAPRPESEDMPPSAEQARALVARALEELAREGRLRAPDPEAAFQAIWAMLHGLISLRISRPHYEWNQNLTEIAFDALERGLYADGEPG